MISNQPIKFSHGEPIRWSDAIVDSLVHIRMDPEVAVACVCPEIQLKVVADGCQQSQHGTQFHERWTWMNQWMDMNQWKSETAQSWKRKQRKSSDTGTHRGNIKKKQHQKRNPKGSFLEILCHSLDILSSAASPVALALSWCFCSCSTFIDLRRISGPIRAEFVRFDVEASKFWKTERLAMNFSHHLGDISLIIDKLVPHNWH